MPRWHRQVPHQQAQGQELAALLGHLQHREVHQDAAAVGQLLQQRCLHLVSRQRHQVVEPHAFQNVKVLHNISAWTWTKKRRKQLMLTWTTGSPWIALVARRPHLRLGRAQWPWRWPRPQLHS